MTDLSTRAAQAAHYDRVRERLSGGAEPKRPSKSRFVFVPQTPRKVVWTVANLDTPKWMRIVRETAAKRDVEVSDLLYPKRRVKPVYARYEAIYRIRNECGDSWHTIAFYFDMDHSAVIEGYRRHAEKTYGGLSPGNVQNGANNPVRGLEVAGTIEKHGCVAAGLSSPAKSTPLATSTSPSV